MHDVLIVAGIHDGTLDKSGLELLTAARQLADGLNSDVKAVIVGVGAAGVAAELMGRGAKTVYVADDPALAQFNPDLYVKCLEAAVQGADPEIILLAADSTGRHLAPALAHRLKAAAITEVIAFKVTDGQVMWTRPVYGGKALSTLTAQAKPQVATIRVRTFDPAPHTGAEGEVVRLGIPLDPGAAASRVVDVIREVSEGIKLEDAKIVVTGGRGMGSADAFKALEELAGLLGGAVGASRAACDAGWVPPSWQIGQTGKTVAPDLYIAIGVSGASQHLAGITGAKNVVAINKDPDAPIFKRANLGIVADYKQVLPHLIERIRETR